MKLFKTTIRRNRKSRPLFLFLWYFSSKEPCHVRQSTQQQKCGRPSTATFCAPNLILSFFLRHKFEYREIFEPKKGKNETEEAKGEKSSKGWRIEQRVKNRAKGEESSKGWRIEQRVKNRAKSEKSSKGWRIEQRVKNRAKGEESSKGWRIECMAIMRPGKKAQLFRENKNLPCAWRKSFARNR